MDVFEGVANTTYIPLIARIYVSQRFPEYFYDAKALELEPYLPEGMRKGSSEYTNMASVARYHNFDEMVSRFRAAHEACNVVNLGAGLDTSYWRLTSEGGVGQTRFYELDLPEVIEVRRQVLGEAEGERLIAADMFSLDWTGGLDATLPTLFVVSGVFQYFREDEVVAFVAALKEAFPQGELLFDATNEKGLKFTNWFIKRTGNADALMYFSVNDAQAFARKTGTALVEQRVFFADARAQLRRRLGVVSRVSMKVSDDDKRTNIIYLRLN